MIIIKLVIRRVTVFLASVLWLIMEISIFGYSFECIKRIINKDFDKCSGLRWLKLSINLALAIGQIVFLIIWAWT